MLRRLALLVLTGATIAAVGGTLLDPTTGARTPGRLVAPAARLTLPRSLAPLVLPLLRRAASPPVVPRLLPPVNGFACRVAGGSPCSSTPCIVYIAGGFQLPGLSRLAAPSPRPCTASPARPRLALLAR